MKPLTYRLAFWTLYWPAKLVGLIGYGWAALRKRPQPRKWRAF